MALDALDKVKEVDEKPIEDKFPNLKPPKVNNIIVNGLFQTIMLEWEYIPDLWLANYEVYASQVKGFTPTTSNLVFRGKTNVYVHTSRPNEVWYFRIRGVNTRGIAGEFSNEISASTVKWITDDILFGPDVAAKLRDLSEISQLLADGSVKSNLLAEDSVSAVHIRDLAVGNAAIANLSISKAKVQNAIIGTAQLDDLAVTSAKIGNLAVDNSKIANLSADKINAGSIRGIDIFGSQFRSADGNTKLFITGGEVQLQQNSGNYVNLSPDGVYGYSSNGSERFRVDKSLVSSAALGTSNSNVYIAPDYANEVRVVDINSIPSDGSPSNYSYRPIRAQGYRFGPTANGYIGMDGELRVTALSFNNEGSPIYRNVRGNVFLGNSLDINTGTHLYIRPSVAGKVRVTNVGTTDSYTEIEASKFTIQSSYRDLKTNILPVEEELNFNALQLLKDNRIYAYNYKKDIEQGIYNRRQVGLMIEDSSPMLKFDNGLDLYQILAVLWNVNQIQQEKIEKLENDYENIMEILEYS